MLLGFLIAELLGYFLHMLLHSNKIKWLSYNHMYHHLHDYPATGKLRSEKYVSGARNRFNFFGIGMEWFIPGTLLVIFLITIMTLLGIKVLTQIIFIGSILFWVFLMFNYMHDAMHLKKFWMGNLKWFKKVRRLHDIHHLNMQTNYGICFFFLDKLFGTFRNKPL